jgi:hypothetical protein
VKFPRPQYRIHGTCLAASLFRLPDVFSSASIARLSLPRLRDQKRKDMFCLHLSRMVSSLLVTWQHSESRWPRLPGAGSRGFTAESVIAALNGPPPTNLDVPLLRGPSYADS